MSRVAQPAAPAWSQRPPLDLPAAAHKPVRVVLQELGSTRTGLTSGQAASRLGTVGRNVLASHRVTALGVLGRQLRNPLLVLLLAAAGVSAATGDPTDGAIIAAIVALSVGLGFLSEYRSELAVAALHASIRHQALVWRDGSQQRLDVGDLVPGDVVALAVGDVVPADLRLVEADQLECDEAVLTGEPVPAVKTTDPVPAGDATLELPSDPQERAVWRAAAAELDGHRRAYGLHHERPAKHAGARVVRDGGRRRRPPRPPADRPTASGGRRSAAAATSKVPVGGLLTASRQHRSGRGPRPTGSARVGCWAPSPAATTPAAAATGRPPGPRWSGWPTTTAAAVRTATAHTSAPTEPMAATLAVRSVTAASWQKGAAMRQHQDPDPDDYKDEEEPEELGTPLYQGSGLSVRALTAEELQRFLDAHHDQPARSSSPRPACPTAGWSAWWSPRWWPGGCGSAPPSR